MFKYLAAGLLAVLLTLGFAHAAVDVNKADIVALDGIKGIGPATSKTILEERKRGGDFKDWSDFEKRVKGVSAKKAEKLSEAGLTVNGQTRAAQGAAAPKEKAGKSSSAVAKAETAK